VASLACHFARPEGYRAYRLATAVRHGNTLDGLPAKLPITAAQHLAYRSQTAGWAEDDQAIRPI
jgi:hypothetical protein